MRCTLETDSPLSFAMPRELQWVAFFGRLSKVFYDGGFDACIIDRPGCSGPWFVAQAFHAILHKTPPPLAHRVLNHTELRRYLLVLAAFRTRQNDPGPQRQGLGRLAPAHQRPQLSPLLIT